ncbi:hypothetical protein J0910_27600 [Nocardiopsis sp. CNT-189]|uniref:hypothetical protein n=1 Tax=Nocardiopsis oceanisediminis TaxID=2816862 RepID=UPI003B37904B
MPEPDTAPARIFYPRPRVHRPDPATEAADDLYDRLSELLRERGGTKADLAERLTAADAAFDALDEHLHTGGRLPTPWRRATAPDQS